MRLWMVALALAACSDSSSAPDLSVDAAVPVDGDVDFALPWPCTPAAQTCTCPTPDANHLCITGRLFDFVPNQPISPPVAVMVGVWDPRVYLSDPTTPPLECNEPAIGGSGCYVLADLEAPPSNIFTLVASDDWWVDYGQSTFTPTAINVNVEPGKIHHVDLFLLSRVLVGHWLSTADVDYFMRGAVVAQFFAAPQPPVTQMLLGTMQYAAGVQLYSPEIFLDETRYLSARDTVGATALTVTQPKVGVAIMPSPVGLPSLGGYTNPDGGVSCGDVQIGASYPHVVFVNNFYCN
jgi:hypothetical protein